MPRELSSLHVTHYRVSIFSTCRGEWREDDGFPEGSYGGMTYSVDSVLSLSHFCNSPVAINGHSILRPLSLCGGFHFTNDSLMRSRSNCSEKAVLSIKISPNLFNANQSIGSQEDSRAQNCPQSAGPVERAPRRRDQLLAISSKRNVAQCGESHFFYSSLHFHT
ncbi:hypothetical protein Mapa_013029 [Marchantia paleacea]|nr:hypothetical protein Mapa_013029 [Marchantia paleacea]